MVSDDVARCFEGDLIGQRVGAWSRNAHNGDFWCGAAGENEAPYAETGKEQNAENEPPRGPTLPFGLAL